MAGVRRMLACALLASCAIRAAVAHSLLTCSDYQPSGDLHSCIGSDCCKGYPRGYQTSVINTHWAECGVYRPGNGGHASNATAKYGDDCLVAGGNFPSQGVGGFACDQHLQKRYTPWTAAPTYTSDYPYAVYKRGGDVCLEWLSLAHAEGFGTRENITLTRSFGPVFIFAVRANNSAEPTQADFLSQQLTVLSYDDCATDPASKLSSYLKRPDIEARPCRGCFTLPQSMDDGRWVFQWLWELNPNEWHTTCWDAVISSSAPSFTAPPHPTRGGTKRTWGASAGLESTQSWAAVPIDSGPGGAPTCPAGLSGDLCSPSGGSAAAGPSPSSPAPSGGDAGSGPGSPSGGGRSSSGGTSSGGGGGSSSSGRGSSSGGGSSGKASGSGGGGGGGGGECSSDTNIEFGGSVLGSVTSVRDAQACCASCKATGGCNAFTFCPVSSGCKSGDGSNADAGKCTFLFTNDTNRPAIQSYGRSVNFVSGIVPGQAT